LADRESRGPLIDTVMNIAQPVAAGLGLSIWDIRFVKEGASMFLRIFIDKETGITLSDCEAFSRAFEGPLDEADPIDTRYYLEVSSPGLERKLTREQHFEYAQGKKVQLRLIRPLQGQRDFRGVLKAYENGVLSVETAGGTIMQINKKDTSFVKLDDFDDIGGKTDE